MSSELQRQGSGDGEFLHSEDSLRTWLSDELKLPVDYVALLQNHNVLCINDCLNLNDVDLINFGIDKLGHRKRIIHAITDLQKKFNFPVDSNHDSAVHEGRTENNHNSSFSDDNATQGLQEDEQPSEPTSPPPPPLPPKNFSLENGGEKSGDKPERRGEKKPKPPPPPRTSSELTPDTGCMNCGEQKIGPNEVFLPTSTQTASAEQESSDNTVKKPRPPKPPRSSTGLKPVNTPPIPPRTDLMEEMSDNNETLTSSDNLNTTNSNYSTSEPPLPVPCVGTEGSNLTSPSTGNTITSQPDPSPCPPAAETAPEIDDLAKFLQPPPEDEQKEAVTNPEEKPPSTIPKGDSAKTTLSSSPKPVPRPRVRSGVNKPTVPIKKIVESEKQDERHGSNTIPRTKDFQDFARTGSVSEKKSILEGALNFSPPGSSRSPLQHQAAVTEGQYVISTPQKPVAAPRSVPRVLPPDSVEYEEVNPPQNQAPVEDNIYEPVTPFPDDEGEESDGEFVPMESEDELANDKEQESPTQQCSANLDKDKREGFLLKQGGKENRKGWRKRYVAFNGKSLQYYKPKEKDLSLYTVPVARILDHYLAKTVKGKTCLKVETKVRTFMFQADHDELTLWSLAIQAGRLLHEPSPTDSIPGGEMNSPYKMGYLTKKSDHAIERERKYLVAIKQDKMNFYYSLEDFQNAMPAHCLEMMLCNVKKEQKNRLTVNTPQRSFNLQPESEADMDSWIEAINRGIQIGLSDKEVINKIYANPSNRICADCGLPDPEWASINLLVSICPKCCGFHRQLGANIAKPRSILMDSKIWTPELVELFVTVGNDHANKFWEHVMPEDDKIGPNSSDEERWQFIQDKYSNKKFFKWSEHYGQKDALGNALREAVVKDNVMLTLQLIFSGASIRYTPPDDPDAKLPYVLAEEAHQPLQMELLKHNGSQEPPPPVVSPPADLPLKPEPKALSNTILSPSSEQSYEKAGYIYKRGPSINSQYKRRYFMLKGCYLSYGEEEKKIPESGKIDLKKVTNLIPEVNSDPKCLDVVTSERTYSLKFETEIEATEWYNTLRNKQVFGVPLENQEVGSDGIPHIIAKCIQFVEAHGLDQEGIYRLSGNNAKIRALKLAFNQDASGLLLSMEDYTVNDVAGTLKAYLRELPDPLLTAELHGLFCACASINENTSKLKKLKEVLKKLPEVNYKCLKCIVGHLVKVENKWEVNKMELKNISIVFGPTLMSNEKMGVMDQRVMSEEYCVIGILIKHYRDLFDVGQEELQRQKDIQVAVDKINVLTRMMSTDQDNRKSVFEILNQMDLDIYVGDKNEQISMKVKVTDTMTAAEVRNKVQEARHLSREGNWELFEVLCDGALERPYYSKERVLAATMEWSFGQGAEFMGKGAYQIVKENYLLQHIQTSILAKKGNVKMRDINSKWKSYFLDLRNGMLTVYKNEKSAEKQSSSVESFSLHNLTLYLGVDQTKTPPSQFGFSIVSRGHDSKVEIRFFCVDSKRELDNWVAAILNLKYPAGMWGEPVSDAYAPLVELDDDPGPLQLGRQSVFRRCPGSTQHVVQQLKSKQLSLRRR